MEKSLLFLFGWTFTWKIQRHCGFWNGPSTHQTSQVGTSPCRPGLWMMKLRSYLLQMTAIHQFVKICITSVGRRANCIPARGPQVETAFVLRVDGPFEKVLELLVGSGSMRPFLVTHPSDLSSPQVHGHGDSKFLGLYGQISCWQFSFSTLSSHSHFGFDTQPVHIRGEHSHTNILAHVTVQFFLCKHHLPLMMSLEMEFSFPSVGLSSFMGFCLGAFGSDVLCYGWVLDNTTCTRGLFSQSHWGVYVGLLSRKSRSAASNRFIFDDQDTTRCKTAIPLSRKSFHKPHSRAKNWDIAHQQDSWLLWMFVSHHHSEEQTRDASSWQKNTKDKKQTLPSDTMCFCTDWPISDQYKRERGVLPIWLRFAGLPFSFPILCF